MMSSLTTTPMTTGNNTDFGKSTMVATTTTQIDKFELANHFKLPTITFIAKGLFQ